MTEATVTETRIACEICGAMTHSIEDHLKTTHPDMSLGEYQATYPGAPTMSKLMETKLKERITAKAAEAARRAEAAAATGTGALDYAVKRPLHEVFGLPASKEVMSSSGKPILVTWMDRTKMDPQDVAMIPDIDPNYVFNIDVLKTLILAVERVIPTMVWGHAGTGKTTMIEQVYARLNRPLLRVQHTANMEESHVLGQTLLRDGATHFELGPLAVAMRRGWGYLADEYDFGRAEVLSLYQPVLEMKALVIKEADAENRIIRPHPLFNFFATGNTNGTGDETGLYQGTNTQNAANYERFGITENMPYMQEELETSLVAAQGGIPTADAKKLVDYASRIRAEYDGGKMSNPISPRTLIYAAKVGYARGDFRVGLEKAFINRLSTVDRETASQLSQRLFGAPAK